VKSELKRGELKVVRIPALRKPATTSYIVYRKDRALSAEAQDFLELLQLARDRFKWVSQTPLRISRKVVAAANGCFAALAFTVLSTT
jgi:hypothetical protein